MEIFRFIFSIIFAPIRWLANLFTQRKDNILEWHFNYGPSFIKIETKYKEQFLPDDLLIAGYILFLARYFFICDDRQIEVVRKFLLNEIEKSKSNEITLKLYEAVFQTLNQMEKDATLGLFKIYNRFLPMPPLTFSEDEEPRHSLAKYSFLVFERSGGNGFGHIFYMSAGPDIILLPLTVGILYEYVVNKLRNKDKKEKLDNSIIDLLKGHSAVDCRSIAGQTELPNEVIIKNNLNY
ncbi:MAG: hypothetical protein KatS3mg098_331 [Candidatus Parcubacteria bacterium]|nr:MAG: hypothetical protein KatS3mg098_331 [Candidatus Parcubacteria bacterium]